MKRQPGHAPITDEEFSSLLAAVKRLMADGKITDSWDVDLARRIDGKEESDA